MKLWYEKSMSVLVVLLLLNLMLPVYAADTVKVEGGLVEGVAASGVTAYKGIPFAAPPIGKLRWKAPQPVVPWSGVLQANEFAPACPQQIYPNTASMNNDNIKEMSEDCLYLNIWTPEKSAAAKLPVMVWIHGGGFALGASSVSNYEGLELAKNGVVVVSIAYRLGAFGFLAHPELSAENQAGISGNYGLLDQIAALKWVKHNIAAFGGDSANVTIFGESAGGISVSMLCASPLAKGLFQHAISQSGGNFGPVKKVKGGNVYIQRLDGAQAQGLAFAQRMGAKSVAELRDMPAEKFLKDTEAVTMGGFWPICDGYVITDDQYKLYAQGKYNDVDVIIGTNSNEGAMFVPSANSEHLTGLLKQSFGSMAEQAQKVYPGTDDAVALQSVRNIFRDTVFAWPSWSWAKLQRKTGKSNVFVYYFDQQQPPMQQGTPLRSAIHTDEINYVFGNMVHNFNYKYTDADKKLSALMMKYWINFAKTGNPNKPGLPEWEQFKNSAGPVLGIRSGRVYMIPQPNLGQLEFLDKYFRSVRDSE